MDLSIFYFGCIIVDRDLIRLDNLSHLKRTDTAGG